MAATTDKVNTQGVATPPNTKLTEMLVVFQDLFNTHKRFQLMDPVDVLAKIIDEPGNSEEILRFIDSYLWPPDYENARKGMAVMAILGYMIARGEAKMKNLVLG